MRLVFATKDLALAGRSFEGFPLLIGSEGWPVEPAQSFLWHTLIESGEALSDLTWEAYGRDRVPGSGVTHHGSGH